MTRGEGAAGIFLQAHFVRLLIAGAILVNLFVVGMVAVMLERGRVVQQEQASLTAENLSKVLEESLSGVVAKFDLALSSVADEVARQKAAGGIDDPLFRAYLDRQSARLPEALGLRVTDAQGWILYAANEAEPNRVNVSDRERFIKLRDDSHAGLVIATPELGRVSGKWVLIFARRWSNPDGSFGGEVHLSVALDTFRAMFSALKLGPHGAVALWNTAPETIARYPDAPGREDILAAPTPASPQLQAIFASHLHDTAYHAHSGTDGKKRSFFFRQVGNLPLFVIVGIADEDNLTDWRRHSYQVSALTALFVLVIGLAALLTFRWWRQNEALALSKELAEAALTASEERFRSLVEGTTDWIWEADDHYRLTWVSHSIERILGIEVAAVLGKRRWDFALSQDKADETRWQAHRATVTKQATFRDFRYWFDMGDAPPRWLSISGSPCFDQTGKFLGYRGSGSDVTAKAEMSLRLRMLSRVVEQSPVSVVVAGPRGAIEYVNAHFCSETGYRPEDVIGQNPRILTSEETRDAAHQAIWEALTSGRSWSGELHSRRKNGALFWERVVISPIMNDEGEPAYFVSIAEDISYRKEVEAKITAANRQLAEQARELARSNAELEQFAYVTSHDLRAPLRAVISYCSLIAMELGPDISDDLKEFIGFAVSGAKRMDTLIVGLLEYSRTGKGADTAGPVPLAEAIGESLMNLTVPIKDAQATVTLAQDLPTIMGNRMEIVRLFQNLIGNAVKYCPPERPPQVLVDCRESDQEWVIRVRDNGIGIATSDIERCFGIFQRLVTQEKYEGTGIGLAICKKIVEHLGGRIWIESVLNEGTTFLVAVPKATKHGNVACLSG